MNNKIIVVVKGVILYNGKVLIIRRDDNDDVGAGTWECVGGKIDFGEGLEQALKREVCEEVGISIDVDKLLYATTFKTDPLRQIVILTYKCIATQNNVILSKEHSDYKWVAENDFRELLHKPIIADMEKHNAIKSIFE
ncbi:MAG TPA: NUDIX domain-containing protein [Clostridiales bacterium]|nr:NUDIX domain-containing protein [Clostridiales bacterium]